MPSTTTMPKGVSKRKRSGTKPYKVYVYGRSEYFATVEEAIAAVDAYREDKREAKVTARAALAEKRARDVANNGQNSAQERTVALALVREWKKATGLPAIVLNDGTKADLLLGVGEKDRWIRVQLKTTGGPQGTYWPFRNVTGYSGMAVVCFRCDCQDAWVYDGKELDVRGKLDIDITPGGRKTCGLALARELELDALVRWLFENRFNHRWPRVTEEDARHEFESKNDEVEMAGIDAYKARFPQHGYAWPDGQNTHVDLVKNDTRQQFKTASANPDGRAGFLCPLVTSAGTDCAGKKLKDPYPVGAFDELVAVAWVNDKAHFWVIPAAELQARGYLSSESQPGKTSLHVHAPNIGEQPNPNATGCKVDTWMYEYFVR